MTGQITLRSRRSRPEAAQVPNPDRSPGERCHRCGRVPGQEGSEVCALIHARGTNARRIQAREAGACKGGKLRLGRLPGGPGEGH